MAALRHRLPAGRWHFQHGPIDLVIGADGHEDALEQAHSDAWTRFERVLDELVGELGRLRQAVDVDARLSDCPLRGVVARRMWQACHPYRATWITPMAAVAGSVAQEIAPCYARPGIDRAWINNGGDIALVLTPGTSLRIGLYANLSNFDEAAAARAVDPDASGALATDGRFDVSFAMPVRGIATSGWRGRSFSRGIADSVTVLAADAASADAAATVIANAVDVDAPGIVRRPAFDLREDSDLGAMLATTDVPVLAPMLAARAVESGRVVAEQLQAQGLIVAAVLVCQGRVATVGSDLA